MNDALVCWKCGVPLDGEPLPLSRLAECRHCRAELHVCQMCEFFEPRWRTGCREERAEDVTGRDRANFCDYLRPRPNAYQARESSAADSARAELEALFGDSPRVPVDESAEADAARAALEELFGKP